MYDELAKQQHLIFADWNTSIQWQAGVLGPLLEKEIGSSPLRILDCACGIGTQALGLAQRGHQVIGTDLSPAAIDRARREAAARKVDIPFAVADMRDLSALPAATFDVVLCADNAIPHLLTDEEIRRAIRAMATRLRVGGALVATVRDYDKIVAERPAVDPPRFFRDGGHRRIVHQVWDWWDERIYTLHLYLTLEREAGWDSLHYTSVYRAWLRDELTALIEDAGLAARWLMPEESGFYQPIVIAQG